jgi:hypothetical protein
VYFPVSLDGDPPESLALGQRSRDASVFWDGLARLASYRSFDVDKRVRVRNACERLQSHFDQEIEEFGAEATTLRRQGDPLRLQHAAATFMQHCVEEFETVVDELAPRNMGLPIPPRLTKAEH